MLLVFAIDVLRERVRAPHRWFHLLYIYCCIILSNSVRERGSCLILRFGCVATLPRASHSTDTFAGL
jgi:hypothetical protein